MRLHLRHLAVPAFVCLLGGCSGGHYAPDFTLRDDRASPWTLSQQRGKIVLLTFGYTHCADTCPATLAKLNRLTRSLRSRGTAIEIAFATVDPQRDTVTVLHRYVERFRQSGESALVGLTGTPQQIAKIERAYHIWAQRIPGKPYDEAHGTAIFLIDRNGRMAGVRDADDADAVILQALGQMRA